MGVREAEGEGPWPICQGVGRVVWHALWLPRWEAAPTANLKPAS